MSLLDKVKTLFTSKDHKEIEVVSSEVKEELKANKEDLTEVAKTLYKLWHDLEAYVEKTPNKIDDKVLELINEEKVVALVDDLIDLIPAARAVINLVLKFPWIVNLLKRL